MFRLHKGNTLIGWLVSSRTNKIGAIRGLKDMFCETGVIIKNPSEYYVDEINIAIYNSIKEGGYYRTPRKAIGILFHTIALMEGDFDNGKDKIEALRKYVGEEVFERYKKEYPEKYNYLLKLNKQ